MAERDALTSARLGGMHADVIVEHAIGPRLRAEAKHLSVQVQVDLAHTVMLARQGILTPEDAGKLVKALREIGELGEEGFPIDSRYGSLLLQFERFIADRAGPDVAGRLHTGRSRNDLSTAVNRIVARDHLLAVTQGLLPMQRLILALAREHANSVMPGYTHLQHAQPTTFGHFLLRHFFTFERDQQRIEAAFGRTNQSALGGAAMVGTSWAIDRKLVAELLAHDGIVEHATDAGIFPRDYPAENAAVLSILATDIGRLAGDLYIWSTWEFDLVEIADDLAGTSSMMPQKKNPQSLERIRGLSGIAIGWLPSVLGTLRSASSSDLDLHFAPDPTDQMASATLSMIELLSATLATLEVHTEVMSARAGVNWTTASNLADELVRSRGLSFRVAHQVVGRLVRDALEAGIGPAEVTPEHLDAAAVAVIGEPLRLPEASLARALDPRMFLDSLVTPGSAKPQEVLRMADAGESLEREHSAWLDARVAAISGAARRLDAEVKRLLRHADGEAGIKQKPGTKKRRRAAR